MAFPIMSDTSSLTTRFYMSGNSQGIAFSMALTTAPEPSSALLLLPALSLLGVVARRRIARG
ncbi:MAG: PEP-CTERM sorting domain-containing protein [Armatimonas sp.]